MSGYDASNVLSRMRKRREEAQNADNNQRGAYRKTNLQVKVAPSFQNNNNNNSNNENSTGGQRSPYALNLGLYNNPPPPNQNQLGGGKLSGSGRLTDPRRNRGSASMSGGGGKYLYEESTPSRYNEFYDDKSYLGGGQLHHVDNNAIENYGTL